MINLNKQLDLTKILFTYSTNFGTFYFFVIFEF